MKQTTRCPDPALKQEILLQVNQRLFEQGTITREVYETAKEKIVDHT